MPKLVITHAVVDIERWLKGKEERIADFSPHARNVTDHVALDGSNNVAITADIDDVTGAQAMMASPSPEAAAHAESHGVIPPMTVYIEKTAPYPWQRASRGDLFGSETGAISGVSRRRLAHSFNRHSRRGSGPDTSASLGRRARSRRALGQSDPGGRHAFVAERARFSVLSVPFYRRWGAIRPIGLGPAVVPPRRRSASLMSVA
jgi:hypothetical protein